MDFDPALLRAFVAIKETGSFTRAAERLHLSQSAISHQIRRLEEQAGTTLLVRTTRRLTLTEDGEDFLRHAEHVLDAQDALSRRFETSSVSGTVRFGVPENFIGDGLPPLLTRFARQFPAVRLDVTVGTYLDLRAQVDADGLDLAVVMALPGGQASGTVLRENPVCLGRGAEFRLYRRHPFTAGVCTSALHAPASGRRGTGELHRGLASCLYLSKSTRTASGGIGRTCRHRSTAGRSRARHGGD